MTDQSIQHLTDARPTVRVSAPVEDARGKRGSAGRGFTLIELMISVALVVFLILGVNQVFLYTSQAVGVGEAINTATRDSRAAQGTMSGDFDAMVSPGTGLTDSASLILSSSAVPAFRDRTDMAGSKTGNPLNLDLANTGREGDTSVPGDVIQAYQYNFRNHRVDTISFFARNLFRRQTGNLGTYVDNMACQEAWIWYGHAWLPDNSGNYNAGVTLPGAGTPQVNPNNLFGSQFVLARVAILLREKSADTSSGVIADPSGVNQRFFDRQLPYPSSQGGQPAADLQPLAMGSSASNVPGDSTTYALGSSRFDLAATSISGFRDKLKSYINNSQVSNTPSGYWWQAMMTPTPLQPVNRFQCNPFIPKPMDSVGTAQASPYFLGGCSQFMVEYAGDYLNQDNTTSDTRSGGSAHNYGDIISVVPNVDGQIDYVLVPQSDGTFRKQILWYGLPRSTNNLLTINQAAGDVATLNDWIVANGFTNPYSFERNLPQYKTANQPTSMQTGSQYLCAWSPTDPKPKLIRITITITDQNGRIPQGLTYQYVFAVP